MTDNWEYMRDFAVQLILHAKQHYKDEYFSQRLTIIHFDHALELLTKAYLLREGYLIHEINPNNIENGLKTDKLVKDILKTNTISLKTSLTAVNKILNIQQSTHINKLRIVRNQLNHELIDENINKESVINLFYPDFRELCLRMFPDLESIIPNNLIMKTRNEN